MALRVGVGQSFRTNPQEAGFEAAGRATQALDGGSLNVPPHVFIVFGSSSYDQEYLVKGIKTMSAAPIFGCSSVGEITNKGPAEKSVVVMAINVPELEFVVGARKIKKDARVSAAELAEEIKKRTAKPLRALVVLPDILAGDGAEMIKGVEDVLGVGFPVVGGSPSDDYQFKKTYQYANGEVYDGAIAGLGLGFEKKFNVGIGACHGWIPVGLSRVATRSEGNVLYELDHKPAIRIYEEYFEKEAEKLAEESLARIAVNYPLGFKVDEGEYLVRNPLQASKKDGSIRFTANIPEGTAVRIMIGGKDKAIESARLAAQRLLKQLNGKRPEFVLFFSNIARRKLYGGEAKEEIDAVLQELGGADIPLLGFYSYGEQAISRPIGEATDTSKATPRCQFYNESVALFGVAAEK